MPSLARAITQPMSAEDFLLWRLDPSRADERWELVDGEPVQLMAGATLAHDTIVVNLIAGLKAQLRGGPCRPLTGDQAVITRERSRVRRPDVIVDCGPRDAKSLACETPVAIFEVLSPSTENVVRSAKLEEYQALASVKHVVLLDQDALAVRLYARAANDAWTQADLVGPEAVLALGALGVELPLAEIYEGLALSSART